MTEPKPVSTKITPEQRRQIKALLHGRSLARFIYDAIREKVEREGGVWTDYEFSTHGGKREGSGRPPSA